MQIRKVFMTTATFYVILLLAVVIYGTAAFNDLYTPPSEAVRSLLPSDSPVNEGYHNFVRFCGICLALYLAIWLAAFLLWRKSYWSVLPFVLSGVVLTFIALSFLPWVYFPYDQYAVPALWFMAAVPMIVVATALSLLGIYLLNRKKVVA